MKCGLLGCKSSPGWFQNLCYLLREFFNFLLDGTCVFTYIIVFFMQLIMWLNFNRNLSLARGRCGEMISTATLWNCSSCFATFSISHKWKRSSKREKKYSPSQDARKMIFQQIKPSEWTIKIGAGCIFYLFFPSVEILTHLGWALFS